MRSFPGITDPQVIAVMDKHVRAWMGEVHLIREIWAVNMTNHTHWKSLDEGQEGIINMILATRAAFPDLTVEVEDVIQYGNKSCARVSMQGTHLGPYGNIPATGKKVKWLVLGWWEIEGDKIVEEWAIANDLTLLSQLGVEVAAPNVGEVV